MLHIKLVKSPIGNNVRNRKTVAALGLRKVHQTVIQEDTPTIRGMIHHVKHMLEVTESAEGAKVPKAKGHKAAARLSGAATKAAKPAKAKAAKEAKAEAPATAVAEEPVKKATRKKSAEVSE